MAMAQSQVTYRTVSSISNRWPKKTSRESFMERLVSTTSRCYACGTLVYAVEKKKTTNHVYHDRCFCCRICKRNLNGATLNEDGDDIYCNNCYRKKERGDCAGTDFQRAAKERAQFIYNERHPDQPPPQENPQRPIQRDLSRQPSLALRQLEREFLSNTGDDNTNSRMNNGYERRVVSLSNPHRTKTLFSMPVNSIDFSNGSSRITEPFSPTLQFLPVSSPSPTPFLRSGTPTSFFSSSLPYSRTPTPPYKSRTPTPPYKPRTPTPPYKSRTPTARLTTIRSRENSISADEIPSHFRRYSVDLTNSKAQSQLTRARSLTANLNKKTDEDKGIQSTRFYFPELTTPSLRRRSSSVNYSVNSRKIR